MKFLRLFAAVPLFAGALWAADSDVVTPEVLFPQLDAILKHAVAQSPTMLARAVDEEIAENDRVAARAVLLPYVGGYYNLYESSDKRSDQPDGDRLKVQKQYYNFSINQPVFFWGERKNSDRMGAIKLTMAKRQYRESYRLFAQEVRSNYLRLIGDKLRVKRTVLASAYYDGQLKRSEDQLAKKVIAESQVFAVRLDAERAQITEERAQFDFQNDKLQFARLTGLPVLKDEEIPDSVPRIPAQTEALRAMLNGFLAQSDVPATEAVNARHLLAIERLNLANNQKRLLPKFSLTAGASQDEQSYTVNVAQKYSVQSLYAGISVNWTIFDGFTTGAAIRSSHARIRQMERDYRVLTQRLAETAQNQFKMIGFYARYAGINDRLLTSSEGSLATRREQFKLGVNSEEDVSQAEIALLDSQITAVVSRADYFAAVGDFLGTVVEDPILANVPDKP